MKDFSYNDIKEASDEAFRMQSNSKFFDNDYKDYKCNCRFEKEEQKCPISQNGKVCQKQNNGFDDDKLLILVLLLILSKNSNDKLLMFALLYIIM